MKLVNVTLALCAACSSPTPEPPYPFAVLPEGMIARLRTDFPVVREDVHGSDYPGKTKGIVPSRHGLQNPVWLSLTNSSYEIVQILYDERTNHVVYLAWEKPYRKDTAPELAIDPFLSNYVDPWLRVVSPRRLREIVLRHAPKAPRISGSHWYVDASTLVGSPDDRLAGDEASLQIEVQ